MKSALLPLLAALLFTASTARAETAEEIARDEEDFIRVHGDRPIASITVEGLKRTRAGVVDEWIDCEVGQRLSTCDLPRIRERLYRLAIFSEVEIALSDRAAGVDVVVRLEEKWTLYPVPMLWYSPGTEMAGVILVEANLLGYNKGVAVGGVYSNRGWYTIAGYNDPNIAFTDLWGTLHTFFGDGLVENDARDGSIEQEFDMRRFDAEYAVGWTFWDRVSPTWTGAVRTARVLTVRVPGVDPANDATVAQQGFELIYSDRVYRDLYDDGLRLSAEAQHAFPLDRTTPAYDDAILDAKLSKPLLGGFVDTRAHAFVGSMPVVFEERLGGLEGSRTIPGSGFVAADRYAYFTAAYQIPFLQVKPGSASAVFFGEIGRYSRNDEAAVTYGGPGVGLRLYLKQVAIPAVGVDVGYETGSKRFAFSVAVGYRPLR